MKAIRIVQISLSVLFVGFGLFGISVARGQQPTPISQDEIIPSDLSLDLNLAQQNPDPDQKTIVSTQNKQVQLQTTNGEFSILVPQDTVIDKVKAESTKDAEHPEQTTSEQVVETPVTVEEQVSPDQSPTPSTNNATPIPNESANPDNNTQTPTPNESPNPSSNAQTPTSSPNPINPSESSAPVDSLVPGTNVVAPNDNAAPADNSANPNLPAPTSAPSDNTGQPQQPDSSSSNGSSSGGSDQGGSSDNGLVQGAKIGGPISIFKSIEDFFSNLIK